MPAPDEGSSASPIRDADELRRTLHLAFPLMPEGKFRVEAVDSDGITLWMRVSAKDERPGGTLSGPTVMMLTDTAAFLAILAQVGPALLAVTSNL